MQPAFYWPTYLAWVLFSLLTSQTVLAPIRVPTFLLEGTSGRGCFGWCSAVTWFAASPKAELQESISHCCKSCNFTIFHKANGITFGDVPCSEHILLPSTGISRWDAATLLELYTGTQSRHRSLLRFQVWHFGPDFEVKPENVVTTAETWNYSYTREKGNLSQLQESAFTRLFTCQVSQIISCRVRKYPPHGARVT